MNHTIEHTGDSVSRWLVSAAVAAVLIVLALASPTPAIAGISASVVHTAVPASLAALP